MKVWIPAAVFIGILWLLQAAVFPVFVQSYLVPRLVLAGLVVLAVSEERWSVPWMVLVVGVWMDLVSGQLVGAYTVGLLTLYYVLHKLQESVLPTSYRYLAVVGLSMLLSLLLDLWIVAYSWLGGKFGWQIVAGNYFTLQLNTGWRLFLTGAISFFLYLFWQELSHRLSRPLRMRRL